MTTENRSTLPPLTFPLFLLICGLAILGVQASRPGPLFADDFPCERTEVLDAYGQCSDMSEHIRWTAVPGLHLNADGETVTVDCALAACMNWPASLRLDCAAVYVAGC